MSTQQLGSYIRQAVALLSLVFGVLTAALSGIHLPIALSSVMTAAGLGLLAVEHYVSDPSTGMPSANTLRAIAGAVPPPAPAVPAATGAEPGPAPVAP